MPATGPLAGRANVPRMAGAQMAAARAIALLRRRPFHVALGGLVLGLALSSGRPSLALAAAGACALGLAAMGSGALGLLTALLVIAGVGGGAARLAALEHSWPAAHPGESVSARANLIARPRPSRFGSSAVLELRSGPGRGARVLARAGREDRWPDDAGAGVELLVEGTLSRPRASPRANFDWPAHLRRRGIGAELQIESLRATGRRRGGAAGIVDAMRRRAEHALERGASPREAALARGMVLGQDEELPETLRDDFRRSGLAHLLAVSGQNVMLLGALALPALGLLGFGLRGRIVGVLALIAIYVPLAGAGPSLQRAGVMGAAGLMAVIAGRSASRWYALLLAAVVTLAASPRVLGDPGWQLSFVAVAGILWLAPGIAAALRALPRPVADGLALTIAATLATAPLLGHHFGVISLSALPANVLALPVVAPIMWIGMIQAAVGQLALDGLRLGGLADAGLEALGLINGLLLGYLEGVARRFADAPGAAVELPLSSPFAVAGAYALLGAVVLGASRARRTLGPATASQLAAWRLLAPARRHGLVLTGTALLLALAVVWLGPSSAPDRLTVSFLDVGQGDATLIQDSGGAAVLFDGGPEEARVARLLRRAGVRRLSAVVATHQSSDHQGGLREVLQRFPVDLLLDGGDGTTDPRFRAVLAEARRRGVRRVPAAAGQTIRCGALTIRLLSPEPRPPGPPPEDPNPRAVVAVVSAGAFDLLLSADAESPTLESLDLPDVEAMKVPHHGSRDEGLPEVLSRLRPQVAAIEVGSDNSYGHPAPETLAALERSGARVYRTDRDGTIALSVDDGALRVETHR